MADPRPGEEALLEFGMLREIFENIGYVFWLRDLKEERILYVSPAFERIWGRSPDGLYADPRRWLEVCPVPRWQGVPSQPPT